MGLWIGGERYGIDDQLKAIKEALNGYEEERFKYPPEFWNLIIIPEELTDKVKREIRDNLHIIEKAVKYGMKIRMDEKGETLHIVNITDDNIDTINNLREVSLNELKKLVYG